MLNHYLDLPALLNNMTHFGKFDLLTILGPTASGKTRVATHLALHYNAEIISGDSRQVYRGMNLGTGKDLSEYDIDGHHVPYHLIDIANPGEKYNIYRFQQDFVEALHTIRQHDRQTILCGGSGLYLESVLRNYELSSVPPNQDLRNRLKDKSLAELTEMLQQYKDLHNTTDVDTVNRAIRAIEIEEFKRLYPENGNPALRGLRSLNIGIDIDRETRRKRISNRLSERLENGMIDEIRSLLDSGVSPDDLIYYGLEYKFVTLHVIGQLSYDEMFRQLEIAIHQFAKRQMTWFRGMEKRGIEIHWLRYDMPLPEIIAEIERLMQ